MSESPDAVGPAVVVEQVVVGGLAIGFRRAGEGPPLVLLHGGMGDSRGWPDQLRDLSEEYGVVAWDAPGCGSSSDPPETFGLPDYADSLAGFVDALDLGRPHVLGHSFGSGLALEFYRRHPGLPRSLILAGPYAGWAGSLPAEEVEKRLRLALETAELLPGRFDPRSIPGLFSDVMPADKRELLALVMSDARPAGTRVMAQAFAEADLRDVLPRIEVPTLLLCGEADERSPLTVGRALHAAIPGSTLVVLPGVGHESFFEAPERFNAEVRSFLRSVG
ncbi:MAG TPA: alpha/beta hydrolase [Acidimicrobiales bacterium]|nr:alpha/beta hydrolase [Acidimicrobiales bacterium]